MTIGTRGLALAAVAAALSAISLQPALAENGAMETAGRTTQPIGHYHFCKMYPVECKQRGQKPDPSPLTKALFQTLSSVNRAVNASFAAKTDLEMWGEEEVWSFPIDAADCEDFVIEKRRRLIGLGLPTGNLLITVLRQSNGDGHAVLSVRTTKGDYVLDNLENRVRLWSETEYTYLKRQSEKDSGVWLTINDGRADAVASVR